jgi:stage II sporulation protein M
MIASQFRQLRDFFRSQDFRHSLLVTGGAFAALIVLAFAAGLIFPAVPAQVLALFSQQMADAGVVSESGSVPALFWNNLRAMVLSVLYGFIPFIYLPALSLGVNALLLGLFAAYFLNNGISMLAYLGGILPHGIFELPALVISLACGIYLCSRINQYVRKNTRGIMAPTLKNIVRVLALTVLPLLAVAAAVEAYVTPAVMQFFL